MWILQDVKQTPLLQTLNTKNDLIYSIEGDLQSKKFSMGYFYLLKIAFDVELKSIKYKLANTKSCLGLQIFFSKNGNVKRPNFNYQKQAFLDFDSYDHDLNNNFNLSDHSEESNLTTRYNDFVSSHSGNPVHLYFFCPFWLKTDTTIYNIHLTIDTEKKNTAGNENKNLMQKSETLFKGLIENKSNEEIITDINQKMSSDSKGEYIKQNLTNFNNDSDIMTVGLFMINIFI